jgi:hypothetical protein
MNNMNDETKKQFAEGIKAALKPAEPNDDLLRALGQLAKNVARCAKALEKIEEHQARIAQL